VVVIGTEFPFAKEAHNAAVLHAESILNSRGNGPRLFKNTLVFLAPDRTRLTELEDSVRYFLAWKSIEAQKNELNLDNFQSTQASSQRENWTRPLERGLAKASNGCLCRRSPIPREHWSGKPAGLVEATLWRCAEQEAQKRRSTRVPIRLDIASGRP